MTLADTAEIVARIETLSWATGKVFKLRAPRDAAGKITALPPYVVVQPADGIDEQTRFTGGRTERNPRCVLHVVGKSYDNAQETTETIKPLFVTPAGHGIQINVSGETGRNLRWETPIPTQLDDSVSPPLIFNTVELAWSSERTS